MLQVRFRTKEIQPFEVNENDSINVVNEEDFTIETVKAKNAKGRRYYDIVVPTGCDTFLDGVPYFDWRNHDSDWVKAGYLRVMNIDEKSDEYIVRVPKKNDDMRELWGWSGAKASFRIGIDVKNWCTDVSKFDKVKKWKEDGGKDNEFAKYITIEQMNAYLCGYFSASLYVKNKKNGFIMFPFMGQDEYGEKHESWDFDIENSIHDVYQVKIDESDDDSRDNNWTNYKYLFNFKAECNVAVNYVQGRGDIMYTLQNIGIVGKDKLDKLRQLVLLRCFNISSVKPVKGSEKEKS